MREEKPRDAAGVAWWPSTVNLPYCTPGCGSLMWTVEKYGRITHKHGCQHRSQRYCQTHPDRCGGEVNIEAANALVAKVQDENARLREENKRLLEHMEYGENPLVEENGAKS